MRHFNLLEEPWVPVRYPDGGRGEVSVRDALLRSASIASIEDPSPLVVASLHRLLLAVLYRALSGPTDSEQARKLFLEGFPLDKIEAYLDTWRDRFWLFDASHPFGQHPAVPEEALEPWTKLTAEHNATANKVLFDHTDTRDPGAKELAACARWLVSTMSFSISGGRGYYPSPSANAMMVIPVGQTLSDTLCLNLVPYPNRDVAAVDLPLWERPPVALPLGSPKRMAHGYADLYTWQARMILLERDRPEGVSRVRFIAGEGYEPTTGLSDPMHAYRTHPVKGRLPVQFRPDRGAWRDFPSLLPGEGGSPPATVEHAARMALQDPNRVPRAILVAGLYYEPPKAIPALWRQEQFAFPVTLAHDRHVRHELERLLRIAEEGHEALRSASAGFARFLLSRGARQPAKGDVREFIRQLSGSARYWSVLEAAFHEALGAVAGDVEEDDLLCQWLASVKGALSEAWAQQRSAVTNGDVWTIRALVKAERPVLRKLKELKNEQERLTLQMEEA